MRAPAHIEHLFRAACALRIEHPSVFALLFAEDADRVQRLLDTIPRPPILTEAGIRLATGGHLKSEEERIVLTFALLWFGDMYRITNEILFDEGEFNLELRMELTNTEDVLKRAWNINCSDFKK